MNKCINCKGFENCCNENEVDSVDIFKSQDICEDFVDGRLSIDELRVQFEKKFGGYSKRDNSGYVNIYRDLKWKGYLRAYEDLNLIKDGE